MKAGVDKSPSGPPLAAIAAAARRDDNRRVERAIRHLAGDIRPGWLNGQRHVEALVGEKTEFVGDDRGGGVGQPKQTDRGSPVGRGASGGDSVTHLSSPSASFSLITSAATCKISLEIGLLRDRIDDRAVLDVGPHVVSAIHRGDLDLAFAAGLVDGDRGALAAVAVCAADADDVRMSDQAARRPP